MEDLFNEALHSKESGKQFKYLEESYKNLYDNTIVAMFVTDMKTLKVIKANKIGMELFGYTSKKALYEGFNAQTHFVNPSEREENIKTAVLENEVTTKIQPMKKLDGTVFWGRIYIKLNDDKSLAYSVLMDVTEQVKLEQENKKYIKILEDIKVDSYKVAHDMKSPLANIMGLANLAINEAPEGSDIRDYLAVIKSEAERLDKNVRQIIVNTAIKKEVYEFQSIDFIKILEDVKFSISFIDGFSDIEFYEDINKEVPFASDKLVITSLFQNLIDNAIKYRNKKAEKPIVKIKVESTADNAVIEIEDNGIGIALDKQQDIFKLFYRAAEEIDGNGLGLFTLKYNIEKLGGNISFKSIQNQGTKFTIVLPNYCKEGVCDC